MRLARRTSLALACALGVAAGPVALASFDFGDPLFLSGSFFADGATYTWGTSGDVFFGSTGSVAITDSTGATVGSMVITSSVIPEEDLPAGKKFGGMVALEPTEVDLMFGGIATADVHFEGIKGPGTNIVNAAFAQGPLGPVPQGQVMIMNGPDGSSIWVTNVPGAELLVFPFVNLTWYQIPSPGPAAALAGAVCLGALRRRR